jgi:hypothetical protein
MAKWYYHPSKGIYYKDGPGLSVSAISELVKGYLKVADLGFSVTASHISGAIAYYLEQFETGDALTGCSFCVPSPSASASLIQQILYISKVK